MWRHACWMWRDSVVRAQTAKRRTKRPESWQGTRWISLLLVILFSKSWFSSLEPWEDRGSSSCLQQPDFNWVKLLLMLHFTLFARCLRDLYIYSTLLPISHAETSYNVNFNCHLITHLDCYSMCPFNHLNNISTMRMKYCTSLIEKCVTSWYTIFNIISVTYGHQLSSANKNKHWADRGVKNFFFFFFFSKFKWTSCLRSACTTQLGSFNKVRECNKERHGGCCYLQPEADQSHDDLGTDLKPLVCSYQTLKLLGQAHLL